MIDYNKTVKNHAKGLLDQYLPKDFYSCFAGLRTKKSIQDFFKAYNEIMNFRMIDQLAVAKAIIDYYFSLYTSEEDINKIWKLIEALDKKEKKLKHLDKNLFLKIKI